MSLLNEASIAVVYNIYDLDSFRDYMLVSRQGHVHVPGGKNRNGTIDGEARARSRAALHAVLPIAPGQEEIAVLYATHLEACVVAMSNNYAQYMVIMSRLTFNMESNGGHIIGRYPVSRVCKLSHKRLHAHTVHAQRDEDVDRRLTHLNQRCEQEAKAATAMASSIKTLDAIRCPKCKTQDGIVRTSEVMRSGDEGMITSCFCAKCKFKWKLSG